MIFEYKTLTLPSSAERQSMLTEMGLGGWELVGFEQGLAYFKRSLGAQHQQVQITRDNKREFSDAKAYFGGIPTAAPPVLNPKDLSKKK